MRLLMKVARPLLKLARCHIVPCFEFAQSALGDDWTTSARAADRAPQRAESAAGNHVFQDIEHKTHTSNITLLYVHGVIRRCKTPREHKRKQHETGKRKESSAYGIVKATCAANAKLRQPASQEMHLPG